MKTCTRRAFLGGRSVPDLREALAYGGERLSAGLAAADEEDALDREWLAFGDDLLAASLEAEGLAPEDASREERIRLMRLADADGSQRRGRDDGS